MRQPAHAYSGLSITIHHRAGKEFAEGRKVSPRCRGAAFAALGPARRAGRLAARHLFGGEDTGQVGGPRRLTATRPACTGSSFPAGTSARSHARAAVQPSARRPAASWSGRCRHGPPRVLCVRSRSASAGLRGWPDHSRNADRIASGPRDVVQPARTGSAGPATTRPGTRPGRSGWRPRQLPQAAPLRRRDRLRQRRRHIPHLRSGREPAPPARLAQRHQRPGSRVEGSTACQRWNPGGIPSWRRPCDGGFDPARYGVAPIGEEQARRSSPAYSRSYRPPPNGTACSTSPTQPPSSQGRRCCRCPSARPSSRRSSRTWSPTARARNWAGSRSPTRCPPTAKLGSWFRSRELTAFVREF
jgi:hypothetical protein